MNPDQIQYHEATDEYLETLKGQLKELWVVVSIGGAHQALQIVELFYFNGEPTARLEADGVVEFNPVSRILASKTFHRTRQGIEKMLKEWEGRVEQQLKQVAEESARKAHESGIWNGGGPAAAEI